jgi:heme exporter protein D
MGSLMGTHAGFILASYAVTALVVAGLILRAILDHRAQSRSLAELESRGARRRSRPASPVPDGERVARQSGRVG